MSRFPLNNNAKIILAAFSCAFIVYIAALGIVPLSEPSEARYALIASSMAKSGDFVTPMLKEVPYLEKPPLTYWATAIAFRILGESELTARLFSGICAWGCVLLVFFIGSRLYSPRVGVYAAAILATSLYHFAVGRLNLLDMPLALFTTLSIWWGYRYFHEGQVGERKKRFIYGCYLTCALAFLTKGLVGILIPFAVLFLLLLFTKRWRDIWCLVSPLGLVIFLAVVLPWLFFVQRAQSDFLYFFFVQEHLLRFTTKMHHRYEPFYFFVPILIVGFVPWLGYLAQALRISGANIRSLFQGHSSLLLWIWAGFVLLFFSISSSKMVPYIIPLFPPLAVVLGRVFATHTAIYQNSRRAASWRDYLLPFLQSLLLLLALAGVLFFYRYKVPFEMVLWSLLPATFLCLLAFLPNYIGNRRRGAWFPTIAILGFLMLTSLLYPLSLFLTPYKTALPLIEARMNFVPTDKQLYQFRTCIYGFDFYTKTRTPLIEEGGELMPGIIKLSPEERTKYFPSQQEVLDLYERGEKLFMFVENDNKYAQLKKLFPNADLLWSNDKYFLVSVEKGDTP